MNLHELKQHFPAAPEYLTQILLIERDYNTVSNARLADRLGVTRPAVSQAVGRLKKLGLVDQDRYGAIGLSAEGRLIAENVLRRHFLLEHLLVGILGYPWAKSDEEAMKLQDSLSDDLTEHLSERLGHPQTCPHGNPMPGSPLEKRYLNAPSLIEAAESSEVSILRITEEGEMVEGLLSFCQEYGLGPGTVLKIVSRGSEEVLCSLGGSEVSLPVQFARNIMWAPSQAAVGAE